MLNSAASYVFLPTDPVSGRVEASPHVRLSVGMADTMDRNIWDIMGEVKPTVNSGLYTSGAAQTADQKSSSTKNQA